MTKEDNTNILVTKTILDTFVEENQRRLAAARQDKPLSRLQEEVREYRESRPSFIAALREQKQAGRLAFIAEIKKSSPSKGAINVGVDVGEQARLYKENGASAISVLTQPLRFNGSLADLEIASTVDIPTMRKEFIIDPYQLYEAKLAGASATLLIVMILDQPYLKELLAMTRLLGMEALVETHDEGEVARALDAGATIIGVNARDLRTMSVDLATVERMLPQIPKDRVRAAESGIATVDDVRRVRQAGADAILVGSAIMESADPAKKTQELLSI